MFNSRKIFLFFLLFFFSINLYGQVLPSHRSVNWANSGFRGTIPSPTNQISILDYGGIGDGTTDNSTAFQNAVIALGGNEGVIFFPSGNYFFSSNINLSDSLIIRGNGSNSTTLTFDLGGANNLINVQGAATQDTTSFATNATKGNTQISVLNASSFSAGDYIRISQVDSSLITSSWALGTVGQIVKINQITNNTITLHSELRKDFNLIDSPKIQKLNLIKNTGVECLKITRLDETNPSHTSSIRYKYAAQSWVKGVESNITNFAHVTIDASTNITITGSYFHHAFDYGGGGRAYGVMIQQTGNECRIEDNVFEHLRHSMIVQSGANGNVFGYNYSFDPFWTGTSLPDDAAGDMVCHGNYPFANLFEGNIAQQAVIDASHGMNGPLNTFFRSREDLYGIALVDSFSHEQNFIGNEITNGPHDTLGLYYLLANNHFEHANNIRDTIYPSGTDTLDDISYYNNAIPNFMPYNYPYPPIGIPNTINSNSIPARDRTAVGGPFTICSLPDFDYDGIGDQIDNCPTISNSNQDDLDNDEYGTVCDCNDNDANDTEMIINNPITSQVYSANNRITSSGTITSTSGVVTFQANHEIILETGFVAEAGSDFTAKIENCISPPTALVAEQKEFSPIKENKKNLQEDNGVQIELNIHPNPFEHSTTLTFSILKNDKVDISIVDTKGKIVEQIQQNRFLESGKYSFNIDALKMSSGVYLVVAKTSKYVVTKRIVVIR